MEHMVSGVTKVRIMKGKKHSRYKNGRLYTYFKEGRCGRGPGIVTKELSFIVMTHDEYEVVDVSAGMKNGTMAGYLLSETYDYTNQLSSTLLDKEY